MRPLFAQALLAIVLASAPAAAQDEFRQVARIVALGDVHGDFEQFVTVLRQAAVIDGKNRWIGGRTHLVQTGDVLDRGPHSRRVMDLLMELTRQAEKAGGKVHALIGNHEAMNVLGDLRYVSAGEYQAFQTSGSEALRQRAFAVLADSARKDDLQYQAQWNADRPLGWVEHRLAFEGKGRYGTWIRGLNAVVKIDSFLFLHGGIGPRYVGRSLADINAGVRHALEPGATVPEPSIAEDPEGPLWYRGLATGTEDSLATHLDEALASFGVGHMVIGHTVTPGAVTARFGGKVIMIDVGLAAVYGGPPACLIIERGVPYALHRGQKLELPLGGDMLPYLRAASALDPPLSKLRQHLDTVDRPSPPPPT